MKLDDLKRTKVGSRPENTRILTGDRRTVAELESDSSDAALGAAQVQKNSGSRFLVRVTSFRRRLIDEDNLCEKYHVDLCRYSGALFGDGPATTKIEVSQEKVKAKDREFVRIEIYAI